MTWASIAENSEKPENLELCFVRNILRSRLLDAKKHFNFVIVKKYKNSQVYLLTGVTGIS